MLQLTPVVIDEKISHATCKVKKNKKIKNQMAKTESLQEARRSGDGPLIGYKLLKWCR